MTPSDSNNLTYSVKTSDGQIVSTVVLTTSALYVGTTGSVKVKMGDGNDQTFVAVPAGTLLPIKVTKVYSTGTTASNIIALKQ